ncbi:MAG: nucleoside/nucleotide kinase family protein [Alkalibacterium sp.]|nr:nucleoside/nucleotide kinase family protein [Alkalibacterium sp.]
MIKKTYSVTGLPVDAKFSENEVTQLFTPLLMRLARMRKEKGTRLIVYLAAPPGAGKTTLSLFLEDLFKEVESPYTFQSISMDGFHHFNQYLNSQTIIRDGQSVPLRTYKGIPETFNVEFLKASIEALQTKEVAEWPTYDRLLHDVSDQTIKVDADIILIEGNYLLLNEDKWKELHQLSDYTIFIDTSIDTLKDRLIDRKQRGGASLKDALLHYERTDKVNAERVLNQSLPADKTLYLTNDGFTKIN